MSRVSDTALHRELKKKKTKKYIYIKTLVYFVIIFTNSFIFFKIKNFKICIIIKNKVFLKIFFIYFIQFLLVCFKDYFKK